MISQAHSSCKAKLHIAFAEKCSSCEWLDRVYPHNPQDLWLHSVHLSVPSWTGAMLGVLSAPFHTNSLQEGLAGCSFHTRTFTKHLAFQPYGDTDLHGCHISVAFGCTVLEMCPRTAPEPLERWLSGVVGPPACVMLCTCMKSHRWLD